MLSCNEHDYIEIVCMYHYPLELKMKSGHIINCTAIDTVLNEARVECIKVGIDDKENLVILSEILSLEVCIKNPNFQKIVFQN